MSVNKGFSTARQQLINYLTGVVSKALNDGSYDDEEESRSVQYWMRNDDRAGLWVFGRESRSSRIEYVYRIEFSSEERPERRYLCQDGEWASNGILFGESDINQSLVEQVFVRILKVNRDTLQDEIEEYNEHVEQLGDALNKKRQQYTLTDIINAIDRYDFDMLKDTIAPSGTAAQELWKLLYSRDASGNIVENDITICTRTDNCFFVRAEREFHSASRDKTYPVGMLIGYDDTPEHFFVHRIPRDSLLDDSDHEWTIDEVRHRMGYQVDCTEMKTDIVSTSKITRLQGNLRVVPSEFETEKRQYRDEVREDCERQLATKFSCLYLRENGIDVDNVPRNGKVRGMDVWVTETERAKRLQDSLGISESRVREEQEQRNIGRLSAGLRVEIIKDLYIDDILSWLFTEPSSELIERFHNDELDVRSPLRQSQTIGDIGLFGQTNYSDEWLENQISTHVEAEFSQTEQVNMQFENHILFISPACVHPNSRDISLERNRLGKIIVPREASVVIGHDEHETKRYTFPRGAYEFRYLIGLDSRVLSTQALSVSNPLTDMQ